MVMCGIDSRKDLLGFPIIGWLMSIVTACYPKSAVPRDFNSHSEFSTYSHSCVEWVLIL